MARTRSRVTLIGGCGVALAALIACGGTTASKADDGPPTAQPETSAPPPSTAPKTTTPTKPRPDKACMPVSAAMRNAIATGAGKTTGGIKLSRAAAVKSTEHAKAYYIAARFVAPGIDEQTGVWASNSLTPGEGIILAVDGFAQEFTDWPDADTTDAAMKPTDESATKATECLK